MQTPAMFAIQTHTKCVFGKNYFSQFILQFSLFLLLFIGLTVLFGTIYESYYTISANFYIYLQYFQQKVFNFNKISGLQTLNLSVNFVSSVAYIANGIITCHFFNDVAFLFI